MVFINDFVLPEKIQLLEEIEPPKQRNHFIRNSIAILALASLSAIIWQGINYRNREAKQHGTNPLEMYLCTEPVEFDEEMLETYAGDIKLGNLGMKAEESEILDFITKREIEKIGEERYLILPVYSHSVCYRLYGKDESRWPK